MLALAPAPLLQLTPSNSPPFPAGNKTSVRHSGFGFLSAPFHGMCVTLGWKTGRRGRRMRLIVPSSRRKRDIPDSWLDVSSHKTHLHRPQLSNRAKTSHRHDNHPIDFNDNCMPQSTPQQPASASSSLSINCGGGGGNQRRAAASFARGRPNSDLLSG